MTRIFSVPEVADLVDPAHYAEAAGRGFETRAAAYDHFRREGQAAGLNPSPFFYADWYAWQNPDSGQYPSVLDHFFAKAPSQPLDPAPFVDSVALLRRHPGCDTALGLYLRMLEGGLPGMEPDLAVHLGRLEGARAAFAARIGLHCLRDAGGSRRNLVWVQSGRAFRLAKWFDPDAPRNWDLLCNWYGLERLDLRHGEIVLRQSGTKVTGIGTVLREMPELLSRYDRVLFLDDDLVFRHEEIDRAFLLAERHDLDLFQPALLPGSNCVWPDLFCRPDSEMRLSTGAEMMMFGFSRRALDLCAPFFANSVSGFGLDLACSHAVRDQGWRCGIIDSVGVEHRDAIDERGGSYYQFMRALGINQKLELYEVMLRLGQKPDFRTLAAAPQTARP